MQKICNPAIWVIHILNFWKVHQKGYVSRLVQWPLITLSLLHRGALSLNWQSQKELGKPKHKFQSILINTIFLMEFFCLSARSKHIFMQTFENVYHISQMAKIVLIAKLVSQITFSYFELWHTFRKMYYATVRGQWKSDHTCNCHFVLASHKPHLAPPPLSPRGCCHPALYGDHAFLLCNFAMYVPSPKQSSFAWFWIFINGILLCMLFWNTCLNNRNSCTYL